MKCTSIVYFQMDISRKCWYIYFLLFFGDINPLTAFLLPSKIGHVMSVILLVVNLRLEMSV